MLENPFRKLDMRRRKMSSNVLRQSQDQIKTMNDRLKVSMVVVLAVFSLIVLKLVDISIISKQEYTDKLLAYTTQKQSFSSPRGTIYDRNGNILVQSVSSLTISYYPVDGISEKEEWDLAYALVDDLNLKATNITDRQCKDMYINYMRYVENDNLYSILSKKINKKIENGELSVDEIQDLILEAIDVSKFDDKTKAAFQVKMRMDASPYNQYKVIVEDASSDQISFVSENSTKYPGFKCTFDWKRQYDAGNDFKSILGTISSQTQGVPSEEQEYYLALGYSLNDRVGISGLEKQYEDLLAGTKSVYNIKFDETGIAYLEEIETGKSGYDLTLTIDINYQKKVDALVKEALLSSVHNPYRKYFEQMQVVVLNPKTGEVYALSGGTLTDDNQVVMTPTDTYLSANRVGSIVKMGTLYMGLNEGVIYPGEVIMDAPMQLKGSAVMSSYNNHGLINDVTAIQVSSNVYMWHIALRLGGNYYSPNMSINLKEDTYDVMRRYFNMFGLGVKTGIDLPNESVGSIGADQEQANVLHYAIGQYDTYTTMQMAQYVATIANNGVRVKPHLLAYATEVNDKDTVVYTEGITVLSTIFGNTEYLKQAQQGMVNCVNNQNYCGVALTKGNVGVQMAAKTGTAENELYIDGELINTTNATMVAYGPTEDPEIVIACSAPNSNNGFGGNLQSNICSTVVGEAAKQYFNK